MMYVVIKHLRVAYLWRSNMSVDEQWKKFTKIYDFNITCGEWNSTSNPEEEITLWMLSDEKSHVFIQIFVSKYKSIFDNLISLL